MSKKSKRSTRSITPAGSNTPLTTTAFGGRPSEFNPDYSYVRQDLRRIAILAGTLVGIMIVLSIFIQ